MRTTSSLGVAVILSLALAGSALAVPLDPPTLNAGTVDRASVVLHVAAGPSGAPGGFVIEYMTKADFDAQGGWPAAVADPTCTDATFTGTPTLTVTPGVGTFRLDSGEEADVAMGKLFDETGLSSLNRGELSEGTDYVFRAKAAGIAGYEESGYSPTLVEGTLVRGPTDCTLTIGFWKNHPESWTRVTSLVLGTVTYSNSQILSILMAPARGNGLISLAHQLIAAKLNALLGAIPTSQVQTAMNDADAMIGGLIVPPVGTGSLDPGSTSSLTSLLDSFNSGLIGPGHCENTCCIVSTRQSTWGSLKQRYR